MIIIFDLDGTIIDSRMRLYFLFKKIVNTNLDFDSYWLLKRQKISHHQLLVEYHQYSKFQIEKFNIKWMNMIESNEMLALDKMHYGVDDLIKSLSVTNDLYLCTARQNKKKVLNQIKNFKLNYFKKILVTEQKNSKINLLRTYLPKKHEKGWIIGDTDYDIEVGKELNFYTCAVLNGFHNEEVLKNSNPDRILDSVNLFEL